MTDSAPLERPPLAWVKRPPQQARSQRTLEKLLDATAALLAERTFDEVSVADIAARAGVSVGSVYTRFDTKLDILEALHVRYSEEASASTERALDPSLWGEVPLPAVVASIVGFLSELRRQQWGQVRAWALVAATDPSFTLRTRAVNAKVIEGFARFLAVRRHEHSHDDPMRAATFVHETVFAHLDRRTVLWAPPKPESLDAAFEEDLVRMILGYLGPPRAPDGEGR